MRLYRLGIYCRPSESIKDWTFSTYFCWASSFPTPFFAVQASHFAFPLGSNNPGRAADANLTKILHYICKNSHVSLSPTVACLK